MKKDFVGLWDHRLDRTDLEPLPLFISLMSDRKTDNPSLRFHLIRRGGAPPKQHM